MENILLIFFLLMNFVSAGLIYLLFHDRLIGKILLFIQVILFILGQVFYWNYLIENLTYSIGSTGWSVLIAMILSYAFIIYFLFKRILFNGLVKGLIKNYVPDTDFVDNENILAKCKYMYYYYNSENNGNKERPKIIYSNIFDVKKTDKYIDYLCVFYVYGKVGKKKKVLVDKVIFRKNLYDHLEKCPNCGAKATDNSMYCSYCNTKLVNEDNILEIVSVKQIDELSLISAYIESKKSKIYILLMIANLLLIPFIILVFYLFNYYRVEGILYKIFYTLFALLPSVLVSIFECHLSGKNGYNEVSPKYWFPLVVIGCIAVFDYAMGTKAILYLLPFVVICKVVLLLIDYFESKK